MVIGANSGQAAADARRHEGVARSHHDNRFATLSRDRRRPRGTSLGQRAPPPGTLDATKRALAAVLDASDTFRSAQELFTALRASGENVGLTTVYNQLRALADGGDVDVLRSDDGESLYRRCATDDHHHHLVCRRCGRTVEVEGPEVERWAERVAAENGFVEVGHTLEIFGTCASCEAIPGAPSDR